MSKNSFENFNEKVSLICEYDSSSPLFVRNANTLIIKNNIEEAINILKDGIQIHTDYPTAYILLGKAYSLIGKYDEAEESFKKGSDIISSEETFEYYKNEIEYIKTEKSLFASSVGNTFIDENKIEDENQESISFEENTEIKKDIKGTLEDIDSIDNNLDKIAKEIGSAKINNVEDTIDEENVTIELLDEDPVIISETLANIYVEQEEYAEAIKIYEKLKLRDSANEEFYSQKIIELKSKLD